MVGTADCRALNGFGARQRRRVSCRRKYYQLLTCFRSTEHGGRRHVGVRNAKEFRPFRSPQIWKNTPVDGFRQCHVLRQYFAALVLALVLILRAKVLILITVLFSSLC